MAYNLQQQIQCFLDPMTNIELIERLVEYTDMNDSEMAMYTANEISKRSTYNGS